ncbi:MAG: hypothetical protein A3B30_03410 [Candidatus Komeilibacteria bacterium RIFCSPLOWO2_01_FULL_52_15]|uniref:Uncharacterized protein n=2 Tax=Candidatus Komeiliibacteriota TaxID=1817908 RepID=A0A1G2BRR2_9BACT|nr:MAG: hypothetical protein A2677_01320 [Candidatus Komeilibacteria bacterium RIFCSPHIGHO2_01_FULL_52_14]OGY91060.1 MAG: hypothetical protein A3B30_03410 [Candidatus Komeilibacteria bacterium RIFCSPLOWO2_01_FULL_52_15]
MYDLIVYVQQMRASGASDAVIRSQLEQAGWQPADIQNAFSAASAQPSVVTKEPIRVNRSKTAVLAGIAAVLVLGGGGYLLYWFSSRSVVPASQTNQQTNSAPEVLNEITNSNIQAYVPTTIPQQASYATVRTTNRPYRCTYEYPSFFGEYDDFTADVLGNDFITVKPDWKPTIKNGMPTELPPLTSQIQYARQGNIGYVWPDPEGELTQYDIKKISEATGMTDVDLADGLIIAPPPDDAECTQIESIAITIPLLPVNDNTQEIIDDTLKRQRENIEALSKLTIPFYLPSVLPVGWQIRTKGEEGYAYTVHPDNPNSKDEIFLEYQSSAHERILVHLIKSPDTLKPPTDCSGALSTDQAASKANCELLLTTPKNHPIYTVLLIPSIPVEDQYLYFTILDRTVISISVHDQLTQEELKSFVDSLQIITGDDLSKRVHYIE